MTRILILMLLAACAPDKPVDSQYYRKCRRMCVGAGLAKARVVETEAGYRYECAPNVELEKI